MLMQYQNSSVLAKSHLFASKQLSLPRVFGGYQVLCTPESEPSARLAVPVRLKDGARAGKGV